MLSWRVLILPFLGQEELYNAFKLDEPWDSPHNIQLLARRPSIYAPPGRKASMIPPDHTFIHVFVGKGTPFEKGQKLTLKAIEDDGGTWGTVSIIEGGKPVPWTKPEDLICEPDQPFPDLPGPFKDRIRVALVAGYVVHLRRNLDESIWRRLVTRHGQDKGEFNLDLLKVR